MTDPRLLADLEARGEAPADLPDANPCGWDGVTDRGADWSPAPRA
jgi:hypothetical protein